MRLLRRCVGGCLVAWMLTVAVGSALAQTVRTPELERQLHRAEVAWRSGAGILEAKARVDHVIEALPEDAAARKLRAQVLLAMGRPVDALVDAREAVQLAPDDGEAHLVHSEAARLCGHDAEARAALDAAAERILDGAALHLRLSWNAAALGQLGKAESFARIALALDPQAAEAYYQLGRVFVLRGAADDAAQILHQGLERALLVPARIVADTTLVRLRHHPTLASYLQR